MESFSSLNSSELKRNFGQDLNGTEPGSVRFIGSVIVGVDEDRTVVVIRTVDFLVVVVVVVSILSVVTTSTDVVEEVLLDVVVLVEVLCVVEVVEETGCDVESSLGNLTAESSFGNNISTIVCSDEVDGLEFNKDSMASNMSTADDDTVVFTVDVDLEGTSVVGSVVVDLVVVVVVSTFVVVVDDAVVVVDVVVVDVVVEVVGTSPSL